MENKIKELVNESYFAIPSWTVMFFTTCVSFLKQNDIVEFLKVLEDENDDTLHNLTQQNFDNNKLFCFFLNLLIWILIIFPILILIF